MKKRSFLKSFNYATNGLVQTFKTERNMRIHFIIAGAVLVMALIFEFSKLEFISLFGAIVLVLFAEMINTALEYAVDAAVGEYHPLVKLCKDIAAGAVLLTAFYALFVGYLLFYDRLVPAGENFFGVIHRNPIHLTIIAISLTVLLIIALKSRYSKHRGTYFQGGTVSGHAAISFLLATIISFNTQDLLVISLAYVLAILVSESRVEGKIHKPIDVFYGGILGILIGILIFSIFGN
ncbi:MAG: diacylglycerol kinase [Ezakiella sp.]|nr:diacylglycerol kinase [Ezakiella sp.]MDD7471995.1 diacylglycerol kinase [Bacillota bacterium]MDY3923959.1 diacylglycerol kinase [Ezakiella sp.]